MHLKRQIRTLYAASCVATILSTLTACDKAPIPTVEKAGATSVGSYFVKRDGELSLVNRAGIQVTSLSFKDALLECDWPVPVRTLQDKWVYVKRTGDFLSDGKYEKANCFHDGAAAAVRNGRRVFLDSEGAELKSVNTFPAEPVDISNGLVLARGCDESGATFGGLRCSFAFFDAATGRQRSPLFSQTGVFSEGLVYVTKQDWPGFTYMNAAGEYLGDPVYFAANSFSEGLAAVAGRDRRYGYIDKKGNLVIEGRYGAASQFKEGLAAVSVSGKWGYINQTGAVVLPFKWQSATRFRDGLARVQDESGYYYVDKTGAVVLGEQAASAQAAAPPATTGVQQQMPALAEPQPALANSLLDMEGGALFKAAEVPCPKEYTRAAVNAVFMKEHSSNFNPQKAKLDSFKAGKQPRWMMNAFLDPVCREGQGLGVLTDCKQSGATQFDSCIKVEGRVFAEFAMSQPHRADRESIALTSLDGTSYMYSVDPELRRAVVDGDMNSVKALLRKLGYDA
jgi:hypothetical protein